MYEVLTAPQQQRVTVESVDLWYKQRAVIEYFVVETVRNTKSVSAVFMEVLWSTEASLVTGQKELLFLKQEKQMSVICLAQGILL